MDAFKLYSQHISSLKRRIDAQNAVERNIVPKDLFVKLKFKEFRVKDNREIEFTNCKPSSLILNYEVDEL